MSHSFFLGGTVLGTGQGNWVSMLFVSLIQTNCNVWKWKRELQRIQSGCCDSKPPRIRVQRGAVHASIPVSRREVLYALVSALLVPHTGGIQSRPFSAELVLAAETMQDGVSSATGTTAFAGPRADAVYSAPGARGVQFRYPSRWRIRMKPIKTHAFEVLVVSDTDANTSIGVVSDAVRISRVEDFGSATDIGERVIDLERKKDGVLSAGLVRTAQSVSENDEQPLTYYLCEYRVNSTRGGERHYAAKVTIANGQLYVMTVQCKESQWVMYEPLFKEVLDSFQVRASQT